MAPLKMQMPQSHHPNHQTTSHYVPHPYVTPHHCAPHHHYVPPHHCVPPHQYHSHEHHQPNPILLLISFSASQPHLTHSHSLSQSETTALRVPLKTPRARRGVPQRVRGAPCVVIGQGRWDQGHAGGLCWLLLQVAMSVVCVCAQGGGGGWGGGGDSCWGTCVFICMNMTLYSCA